MMTAARNKVVALGMVAGVGLGLYVWMQDGH